MTTIAADERAALADLLDALAPDAPTLCEGWDTVDLAAHLVARDRRPDAAAGLVVAPLARWTRRVQDGLAAGSYRDLVAQVRQGPPWWNPAALPLVAEATNAFEFLVHHEDVRRAQPGWEPRDLPPQVQDAIWDRLGVLGRGLFRRAGVGVVVERDDLPPDAPSGGRRAVLRPGSPAVTLRGAPLELLLVAYGRRDHARVTVDGDPDAISRWGGARLGL